MNQAEKIITEEKSYYAHRTISSISNYKNCIDKFTQNFSNEIALDTDTPLFLDTNILLRYYSISFVAREKLFEFLQHNQKRIILTTQTQIEFLRNREDIIQRFFEQVTSKVPKDFNNDIVNKMKSFLENYKVILKDYAFVELAIEKYQGDLEELLNKLNLEVDKKKKEHNDLLFKDKFLDFLATCSNGEDLNLEELELIKKHFDILAKNITSEKVDSLIKKPDGAFPGLGDIKEKPENPYGDYIIFHEILKYMTVKQTDVIFLTFDNTKGDWMNKNKSPHLHYVQNVYDNTNRILYIVDAERALGEMLNVNISSLIHENIDNSQILITTESLMNYALNSDFFKGVEVATFSSNNVEELKLNGYSTINEIANDLEKEKDGIREFHEDNQHLNFVGLLRASLRVANPNYKIIVHSTSGKKSTMSQTMVENYKRYRTNVEGDKE